MAEPSVRRGASVERTWLDDRSWIDVVRGWIDGADDLYDILVERVPWQQGKVFRYERWIDEPRLGAGYRMDQEQPHPVFLDVHRALRARYGVSFDGYGLAWYRNERDSVAFHRDRDMRWLDDTVIALVVLGARRRFLLRPRANRYAHDAPDEGATHDLSPGQGDLLVMGGACQVGWEHSVPKLPHPVAGRISAQWRWTSRTGRQERGGSYGDPLHFDR